MIQNSIEILDFVFSILAIAMSIMALFMARDLNDEIKATKNSLKATEVVAHRRLDLIEEHLSKATVDDEKLGKVMRDALKGLVGNRDKLRHGLKR